jgi:nitronate monooxygenase
MSSFLSVAASLQSQLALPVIAAPMFIVSQPELVLAQCLSGIIGSFPALNARPKELLDEWLTRLDTELGAARVANPGQKIAPYAVNQIVHASNDRLDHDMALCVKHKVPLIITSLRPPGDVVKEVHGYGGLVFHDVISVKHAQKAIGEGVDGLILVCAGAGGHAGTLSPFALVSEVRKFWDGPIALSGAISRGEHILAAQALGADFAYIGTRFIATQEAAANPEYKQALVDSSAADIVYSSYFTGVHGNYLRSSIVKQGLDPESLPVRDKSTMQLGASDAPVKAWKDIWGAGQGVGSIDSVDSAAELIARMKVEYAAARARLSL